MSLPKPYYDQDGITIYHADCRDILPHLPKIDLVLTDPPYGIGANKMTLGNGHRKVFRGGDDWDAERGDVSVLTHCRHIAKHTVVWGGNYFADALPPTRGWLVWDKGTGCNDFADCELAWTDIDTVVKKLFVSWVGANAKEKCDRDRFHPTQKPLGVMKWCISLAGDVGTVLDPFMGSGTTLVAAKDFGLRAIGIEREERYCEIAVRRLAQGVMDFSESA